METSGELTAHLTTGAVVVYVIEWLKASGWVPWIRADSTTLNRLVSAVTAAAVAFGINWTYTPDTGTLVVQGLTLSSLALTFWEWLKQYVVQQLVYDGVVQKSGAVK
jgi:hypothetical protein